MADLVAQNLVKDYPTRGEPLHVLCGVSLELSGGQNLAVLGPSGSGKSTLLYLLGALDRPTSGTVRLDGVDPYSLDEKHQAQFRNRQVGFVFQDHHLLPQLTVLENVLAPTLAHGGATAEEIDRARRLLGRVGLDARRDHRPAELSGGERQRVAICRAMVLSPRLMLADEPTGNLDRSTAAQVSQLLLELQAESGAMLVVVTHSLELAARLERRMELDAGRLVAEPTA